MPTLLSITPTHATIGSELHTIDIDYLPLLASPAALTAAIWTTCAIICLTAGVISYTAFLTVRRLIATCAEHHPHSAEYAQLVTVHPEGATTKVANLDHYRHRRHQQHNHPNTPPTTDRDPGPDDAPA